MSLAYKESSFLEACIKSLLKGETQSNIIIATSTPNEYIRRIAGKYDLPVNASGKPSSIGGDWNFALGCVRTKYATIVHQDDIYLPGFLKASLKELEKPGCLISFTNYSEIKNNQVIKPTLNLYIKDLMLLGFLFFRRNRKIRRFIFSFGNPISCPAVSYNLELLQDFGFDESMKVSLDWEAWVRIGEKKGYFGFIPKRLVLHRIHAESETTNAIENNLRTEEDLVLFKRFWPNCIAKKLASAYNHSQKTNFD